MKSLGERINDLIRAFPKRVAGIAGGIGIVGAIASQIPPIGEAFKTIQDFLTPSVKTEFRLRAITDDERYNKSILVRDAIKKLNPEVIAIAYFRLIEMEPEEDPAVSNRQLRYVTDSGDTYNNEVWFFDVRERNMILSSSELVTLQRQECFLRKKAGNYPRNPEKGTFNAVFCPTLEVFEDSKNPGLLGVRAKDVIAIAIPSDREVQEPYATRLFGYALNLEYK